MPLPASVTTVPVHIKIGKKVGDEWVPANGSVTFSGLDELRDTTGKVIAAPPWEPVKLDAGGEGLVSLIDPNNPNISPSGWAYTVYVATDVLRVTYQIEIPANTPQGTTLELADIAPAVTPSSVVTYALDSAAVHKTGDETVDGKKSFVESPTIPAPSAATDAASKGYVDSGDAATASAAAADATSKANAAQAAAIADAATRYARVFAVAAPTGVAATDTAAITAQANAASAAGGGVVALRAGTYSLNGPLPVLSGVTYVGVEPVIVPQNVTNGPYLADMEWNYGGGTVLVGDGTFAGFEANAVDQASVQSDIGNTQISNAGIVNVGIDNVTYGVHVGAVNIMGMVWGTLRNVYVKNASAWGVKLVNFQHCTIDNIRTCLSQNAQYYGNLLPKLTLMCGNSMIGELFNIVARDGRDNRLCRGIVFEAGGTNATFNEVTARRIQVNQMSRALLSVTATLTNGSASIGVPDGTKFAVGMPIVFTSTGNGFTANQCYIVASVAGNTITVANDRVSAAISATGSGTLPLETYGFPNVEVTRQNSGALVRSFRLGQIDVEGSSTAALYVDGAQNCRFDVAEQPTSVHNGVVGRTAQWCDFFSEVACNTDFDANSTSSDWFGQRGRIIGRELSGMWLDSSSGVKVLAVGGGQSGQTLGDIHTRTGGFLYPNAPLGERIFPRDTAITLGGFNGGDVVFAGSSPVTMTLPTIVTDTNVGTSHIGLVFEFYNVGTGTLTVATDGTQVMNKVVGRTSVSVAPGNSLKVIAAKDNSGNLFWLAKSFTLIA